MSDFKLGVGVVIKVEKDKRGMLPQVAVHLQLPRFLVCCFVILKALVNLLIPVNCELVFTFLTVQAKHM